MNKRWLDFDALMEQITTPQLLYAATGAAPGPLTRNVLFAEGSNDDSTEKRTVTVGRRRRSDDPGAGERERADAPTRDREPAAPPAGGGGSGGGSGGGGSARPPKTGGAPRPFGGSSGGRPGSPLMYVALIAFVLICVVPFYLFNQGGDSEQEGAPPVAAETVAALPTRGAEQAAQAPAADAPAALPLQLPTKPPSTSPSGDKWLVMLYQDADDKILEQDIYLDLNEAERVGSTDNVQIVTQVDRFRTGYQGDGDWTSAKRFFVTRDANLKRVGSQLVADLGEVNMADGNTLIDFVTWAIESYPADKYALILADHGMGWPGGWSDPTAPGGGGRSMPLAQALGDQLYLMELDHALGEIRTRTGIDKFELIGMDACLMGHLEVFTALAPHARYAVASQETEPALGWAYTGFLSELAANPAMDGAALGRAIVESYIQDDQRIVDDQERAEFAGRGASALGPTARQVTQQLERDITLTALDLGALPALNDSVNNLAFVLQGVDARSVAKARSYAQAYTSIFGSNLPPSYIDLGNFVQLLTQASSDPKLAQAAQQVLGALQQSLVAEKHGPNRPGATGVSIYFPNSKLYGSPAAGPQSYTVAARRFAESSLWDDFLAFTYTGREFDAVAPSGAVPSQSETVRAPAAGGIQVSPVRASATAVEPGETILLSSDISGENIGYVKLLVGYLDQAANSINLADSDYLESPDTREVDGVFYPDWGEGEFTMEFEWEPIVYAIDDGETSAVALFTPASYGATPEEATYTVDGTYTFADGGEQLAARLYFRNEVMYQVFGFTGDAETGAPREITPQIGDRFTVAEQWLDLDAQGNVVKVAQEAGNTLTFGDQPFEWKVLDAAAGSYIVGFIVEDLDGNQTAVYEDVTVE